MVCDQSASFIQKLPMLKYKQVNFSSDMEICQITKWIIRLNLKESSNPKQSTTKLKKNKYKNLLLNQESLNQRLNRRGNQYKNLLFMSTSAFLQTMLAKRRPIPLMEVRANMIFCLPSTFVFCTRRMCWNSSFATSDCKIKQQKHLSTKNAHTIGENLRIEREEDEQGSRSVYGLPLLA